MSWFEYYLYYCFLKGSFNILALFIHPQVVPRLGVFFFFTSIFTLTKQLMVAIELHSIFHTVEVNGYRKLFDFCEFSELTIF